MSTAPFTVRIARSEELERAGQIVRAAYVVDGLVDGSNAYADQLEDARSRAQAPGVEVLVAVANDGASDEQVAATITVAEAGSAYADIALAGELELRMLGVDHAFRGRRLGELMMASAIEFAHERGLSAVWSLVHDNEKAERLYERMGLRRVPERDWYVPQMPELGPMLVYCAPPTISRAG